MCVYTQTCAVAEVSSPGPLPSGKPQGSEKVAGATAAEATWAGPGATGAKPRHV